MTRKAMRRLGRQIAANLERTAPARIAKEREKDRFYADKRAVLIGLQRGYQLPPSASTWRRT